MDFEEKFGQFKIQVEQELLARQVVTLREMEVREQGFGRKIKIG